MYYSYTYEKQYNNIKSSVVIEYILLQRTHEYQHGALIYSLSLLAAIQCTFASDCIISYISAESKVISLSFASVPDQEITNEKHLTAALHVSLLLNNL